ncbi:unnamed protein product [Ilex paraguariensis]|uniref:Uncharacterized protein n=1 Tax=Ilex paraguariensis TaxID=185542 RepID=A0ABC8RNS4_9AQUA
MIQNKTAFTMKKDYGKGEREAQWATAQHTLHGLQTAKTSSLFNEKKITGSCLRLLSRLRDGLKLQGTYMTKRCA